MTKTEVFINKHERMLEQEL